MNLLHYNNPILTQPAHRVSDINPDHVNEMIELASNYKLTWLAAPQIGLAEAFFVAHVDGDWELFLNPTVVAHGSTLITVERDPHSDITIAVKQHRTITLTWEDLGAEKHTQTFHGLNAAIMQNAMRFLDGRAFNNQEPLGDWA